MILIYLIVYLNIVFCLFVRVLCTTLVLSVVYVIVNCMAWKNGYAECRSQNY